MPRIIPIRDLKNTSEISDMCHSTNEPVFVTKNGYGDMVVMSMETYEKTMLMNSIYEKLDEAEKSVASGDVIDAFDAISQIRKKYNV
ncbi:MAG: type II toxin-antitoxin system Phd/YefM family antitoxin [Clostridia bacterium]|nr:type II toxin-antitoxin system Phd/YefM family antitoxin [Clostridia bacterium]